LRDRARDRAVHPGSRIPIQGPRSLPETGIRAQTDQPARPRTRARGVHVGVDGACFCWRAGTTGVHRYTSELCRALDQLLPEARFSIYLQKPPACDPGLSDRWARRVEPSPLWRRARGTIWLKLRARRLIAEDPPDVFWATNALCPRLPPMTRSVVTVHDLNHKLAPGTMPRGLLWSHRLFFARDVLQADAVIVNSHGTAARLKHLLGREASAVVRCGVSPRFQRADPASVKHCMQKYRIGQPYLLSVATREPRKNLGLLVEAFLSMKRERLLREHCLVLAGAEGWRDRGAASALTWGPAAGVLSIGYVPDEDLPALYSGAAAFIFPSLYEGFGLPVLEARACGTTVVATDTPELREAGGEGAIYIDPTEEGIRVGILEAISRPHTKAAPRETSWNWEDSAQPLAELLLCLGSGATRSRTAP
jgi:glycosyltransferase involved in cell wall biosynthesis